jgi:hypothetical protein
MTPTLKTTTQNPAKPATQPAAERCDYCGKPAVAKGLGNEPVCADDVERDNAYRGIKG